MPTVHVQLEGVEIEGCTLIGPRDCLNRQRHVVLALLYRRTIGGERHRYANADPINSGLSRWRWTLYLDAVAESGTKERSP